MPVIVRGIVSESAQRKRVAIDVFGIAEKSQDKISASHVMCQVAEEKTPVRVVPHVLDDGPTVGIAVCFFDFRCCRTGKTLQEQGAYVGAPYAVHDRFVRKNGIGLSVAWIAQSKDKRHNNDEGSHRKKFLGASLLRIPTRCGLVYHRIVHELDASCPEIGRTRECRLRISTGHNCISAGAFCATWTQKVCIHKGS